MADDRWLRTYEDHLSDPETRAAHERAGDVIYPGPYAGWWNLIDDVRRMNLFREVELHTIAIGEVQLPFMRALADIGMGRSIRVGQ